MNKYLIILSTFFLLIPFARADSIDSRPLFIFSEKKAENIRIESGLQSKYGNKAFNGCMNSECGSFDMANPFSVSACLYLVEICLDENLGVSMQTCEDGQTFSNYRCVSVTDACRERYGEHSYFTGEISAGNEYVCECATGFSWNQSRTKCLSYCVEGEINYSLNRQRDGEFSEDVRCMGRDVACQSEYGEDAIFSRVDEKGNIQCVCQEGYVWNDDGSACTADVVVLGFESPALFPGIYMETVDRERSLTGKIDSELVKRLSGQILIQVEEAGEAWYVNMVDQKRYFLSSPTEAFNVMRELSLGVKHEYIVLHDIYPASVAGRILLDVEDSGKAYYIYPIDRRAYYLGRPSDAFRVMRELGLGVTNADVRKITVGKLNDNYCQSSDRELGKCEVSKSPVCGWFNTELVSCETYPCAANYQNSCEACRDEIVSYWELGFCPK